MNLIIAGCRDFTDRDFIYEGIDSFINEHGEPDLIIEGGAKGVDRMAYYYAKDNGIPVKVFPADWNKYGRAAGPIRNEEMAKHPGILGRQVARHEKYDRDGETLRLNCHYKKF